MPQVHTITERKIRSAAVPPVGLGCMSLSHAYGIPPDIEVGRQLLQHAVEIGVTHFDTAALYGFGRNEELVGQALKPYRKQIFLASKCGMTGVSGRRVIDGRPETLKRTCEEALRRLQTEVIDLYYLHRVERDVPLEDSIGALVDLIGEGKIRDIGLSEVSADMLRRACEIYPVAAVQSEYSLWSRNAEIAVLDACAEHKVAYVAFSPLARGFLADLQLDPAAFADKDIRRGMPRFQEPNFSRNAVLREEYRRIADRENCTPAQLALAWLLKKAPHLHVIPGTTNRDHLVENFAAMAIDISDESLESLEKLINPSTISGGRYNQATQAEISTERMPDE